MTHEEEAEKVLDRAYDLIEQDDQLTTVTERGLLKAIAEALAEAEKKGREEEYQKSIIDMKIVVEEAAKQYTKGWNEAIKEAMKVVEEYAHYARSHETTVKKMYDKLKSLLKEGES